MQAAPARWSDLVDSDDDDDIPNEFSFGDIDSKLFQALTCPAVPISDLDFSFFLRPGTIVINPKSNLRSICPIKCL